MSAWSDWRCGALSDDEFRDYAAYEARRDEILEEDELWEEEESEVE